MVTIACLIQLALIPQVPDPIATHWGATGEPDGFSAPHQAPIITAATGLGTAILLGLLLIPSLRRGERGPAFRFMGAVAAGTATLIAVLFTGILWIQRGLDDAHNAEGLGPIMLLGFGAAVALGFLAWLIQPRQETITRSSAAAESLELAASERAVWLRYTGMPKGFIALMLAVQLAVLIGVIITWRGEEDLGVSLGLIGLLVILLAASALTIAFRVRVDQRGLTVVSVFGVPRFNVAPQDIVAVETTHVNAVGEFGGWGLRLVPKRFGVITRTGPAIQVRKTNGRDFVVTVPDAETGAALLHTVMNHQTRADS